MSKRITLRQHSSSYVILRLPRSPLFPYTTLFRSSGTSRHVQQLSAFGRWKPFDRVSERRSWNLRSVRAQVTLEPLRVGLARFPKHPANGLLNQIFLVHVQLTRDTVSQSQRGPAPYG